MCSAPAQRPDAAPPGGWRVVSDREAPLWAPAPDRVRRHAARRVHALRRRPGCRRTRTSPATPRSTRGRCASRRPSGRAVWDFAGVRGHPRERSGRRAGRAVLEDALLPRRHPQRGRGAPRAIRTTTWRSSSPARTACAARSPAPSCTRWCHGVQQALRAAGVGPGDRVAAWMPNAPETYALMLAAASLGAVFSSTSPDFGVEGVVDRFGQIEPTVLVAADAYRYGGQAVRLPRAPGGDPRPAPVGRDRRGARVRGRRAGRSAAVRDAVTWSDWLAPHAAAAGRVRARCRSTTRGTCCSRRAPPARRSASSTGPAACCSSTCPSSSSSATSAPATGSATSRPRAG